MTSALREIARLLRLAGPIVASQLASVLMGLVDTVMAGRAGAREQAIVGLGVAIWIPLFLALMGVVQALSPIVAHHHGAGDGRAVVADTQQGVWLGLLLGLLPLLMLPAAGELLLAFGVAPDLAAGTRLFLQGIALGMPAALMFRALAFYSASINLPQPSMVLGFVGLGLNAVFNDLLIHGRLGLPALGGAGCGWATGLCMWITLLLMAAWTHLSPRYAAVPLWRHWPAPDARALGRLLRLGLPMGGANLVEVAAFTGVALLIGSLGAVVIAAHQAALNFASLLFMLPAGLSTAVTIRVAQELGAGRPHQASQVAWWGLGFALALAVVVSPLLALGRDAIAALYSPDPEVQRLAARLLLFAAVWHTADAVQVCAAGALRGYRITGVPLLMMTLAYWGLALPLGGLWAAQGWPGGDGRPAGVDGYWAGLLCGLLLAALALAGWLLRTTRATTRGLGAGTGAAQAAREAGA